MLHSMYCARHAFLYIYSNQTKFEQGHAKLCVCVCLKNVKYDVFSSTLISLKYQTIANQALIKLCGSSRITFGLHLVYE